MEEVQVVCPHCGEPFTHLADVSAGSYETIEDCWVCCRPMKIRVECEDGEIVSADAELA
jgi:hypothetical protein